MIFSTDLDGTMIFPHRLVKDSKYEFHPVEYHQGKKITYMTPTAVCKLKMLMGRVSIIPATTRSLSQFSRVNIFSSTQYAILNNGGTILYNGAVQLDWKNSVTNVLRNYPLKEVLQTFYHLPGLIETPKIIDGIFVFAKSDQLDLCKQVLQNKLDTKIWNLSFHGSKIYAIPHEITKGNALKFITEELMQQPNLVVAAGNDFLDLSMLKYANLGIIPQDCVLANLEHTNFLKIGIGLLASDAILEFVSRLAI